MDELRLRELHIDCNVDSLWNALGPVLDRLELGKFSDTDMEIFEVTAAGFDAGTDDSDELVYWVGAANEDQVKEAIKDTGAKLGGTLFDCAPEDVDFYLPRQSMVFGSVLLEAASKERNKRRAA